MSFVDLFRAAQAAGGYNPNAQPQAPTPLTYSHEGGQWMNPITGFPGSLDAYTQQFGQFLNFQQQAPQGPQGFNFPITPMQQIPQANQTPFASMLAPLPAPPAINFQPQQPQQMQSPQLNLAGLPQAIQNAVPAYLKGGV